MSWLAPVTGNYTIEAVGAQGAGNPASSGTRYGGLGALVRSTFTLDAGTMLQLAVGGMGISDGCSGGGGGGSFVVSAANAPMLIAGGGGGVRSFAGTNGSDASITRFAGLGSGSSNVATGALRTDREGLGGVVSAVSWGSAGAGFNGNGPTEDEAGDAQSWFNGLLGGGVNSSVRTADGGFGGGGSGNGSCGGGGGGGYSGGDGGWVAGGGASYLDGSNQYAERGVGTGNGRITITTASVVGTVPEPATIVLLTMGLLVLVLARFRRTA